MFNCLESITKTLKLINFENKILMYHGHLTKYQLKYLPVTKLFYFFQHEYRIKSVIFYIKPIFRKSKTYLKTQNNRNCNSVKII